MRRMQPLMRGEIQSLAVVLWTEPIRHVLDLTACKNVKIVGDSTDGE